MVANIIFVILFGAGIEAYPDSALQGFRWFGLAVFFKKTNQERHVGND